MRTALNFETLSCGAGVYHANVHHTYMYVCSSVFF